MRCSNVRTNAPIARNQRDVDGGSRPLREMFR
jgi:hypothetical protein